DGPYCYWMEVKNGQRGRTLEVSEVLVPSQGEATRDPMASIPIDRPTSGGDLGPLEARVRMLGGDQALVQVRVPRAVKNVQVRVQSAGRSPAEEWQDLPDRGRVRAGRISTTHIPPGPHMIEIRSLG